MDPLIAVVLFWIILSTGMSVFGIACIKYGVYTSGNLDYRPTLDL
jgi:hypothetical protein